MAVLADVAITELVMASEKVKFHVLVINAITMT